MSGDRDVHLRCLRMGDAEDVLAAFESNADWALTDGGLARLALGHRVNNPTSGAVARAAGFVREGTERAKFLIDGERIDVDTYGRLRSDRFPEVDVLEMRRG